MAERTIQGNGIEIWTEDFGNLEHPPILLVMGASAQGILWTHDFIQPLVNSGRYVIRYDNRDTGQTTCFDFEKQPYTLGDMARDAVAVLDAYGLRAAHVIGASMGGMIGQTVAIDHPDRILTLTSIMSTPGGSSVADAIGDSGPAGETLPGPSDELMEVVLKQQADPPRTREERIANKVELFRHLTGSLAPFDEPTYQELFEREYARARDWDAQNNHGLAIAASPDRRDALAGVSTPTLVIHGTEDPILPYEHGVATAKAIPGAELVSIAGMGHELPAPALERITGAILRHTAAAR
ncbi:MAG: alpha/beta hydrolase [Myxococcota bacterium]